jgi:hypothetical protein
MLKDTTVVRFRQPDAIWPLMVGMPTAAVRWSASEQPESTLLGHSASHSERLFVPLIGHLT